MAWTRSARESVISISFPASLSCHLQRATSESSLYRDGLENISAHDILQRDVMHCGFLYKKAQERKVEVLGEMGEHMGRILGLQDRSRKWQLRYVIIYQHYVLYYKDDKARKPQGVFCLKGYNRVMREEGVSEERRWSFKIIGLRSDARTWYFSAASEKEMKLWMAYFKVAMEQAIHGKAREKSLKILQDMKYKNSHRDTFIEDESRHSGSSGGSGAGSNDPLVYEDIEMPLYDDTASAHESPSPHLPRHPPSSLTATSPNRPLPSLPGQDIGNNPRRSSAGARSGIPLPIPGASYPSTDETDTPDYEEDYITPDMEPSLTPPMRRPLPPTPGVPGGGSPVHMSQLTKNLSQVLDSRSKRQTPAAPQAKRLTTRQPSIDEGTEDEQPGLRRGPEGNSFRKGITERPHFPVEQIIKPPISAKPSDAIKPATRPKPKIAVKPPVTKLKPVGPSPSEVLLPASAAVQDSDKVYTEGLLRNYRIDGMYLVRLGTESGQVLMVWDSQNVRCKHYKIFQDQDFNLHLDHVPKFGTLPKLLEHYKTNPLPNSQLYLQKPYLG